VQFGIQLCKYAIKLHNCTISDKRGDFVPTAVLRSKKVTGKVEEKEVDVLLVKQRYYYGKGEFVVMAKELAGLLKSPKADKLTGLDFRVLMALIERADANNRIRVFKQWRLAEDLQAERSSVTRSLQRLRKLGVIYEDNEELFFDPQYIYTGGLNGAAKILQDDL
jgi:hypothetical protein